MDLPPLPMSISAFNAFQTLPLTFMNTLTSPEKLVVLEAFMYLDFASQGTKVPRALQLRANLAVKAGQDVLVRSGTGSGKTISMILPVLSLGKDAIVITISPLRLIQDNHVVEFEKYGIKSIAINCYTPKDQALWKAIETHARFQHYSVSPEQCGPYQGHIPHFAKLLHDPKWAKRIKLLQIDEAHFVATAGQAKGKEGAFRPSFSDLGERLRVHLPSSTPVTAYSASIPPEIASLLIKTLRMDPKNTIKLEFTTNRPNLVHAVIAMVGTIDNFANCEFLLNVTTKSMVFLDNKKKSAKLARHLNSKLSPAIAKKEPFRHYHSSMSKPYLEATVDSFKQSNGDVKCLIATESASNGFDVPDIGLIVQYGVPKTMIDTDQRGGRGGRDGRECLVLMIAEQWAFEDSLSSNPDHNQSAKEKRTDRAVVEFASSRECRRRMLAKHNNDRTPAAHDFSGIWCCDNDSDTFDLSYYSVDPLIADSDDDASESRPAAKKTRKRYRRVTQRQPIVDALQQWVTSAHQNDPVAKNFPVSYILDSPSMALMARQLPHFFRIPRDVTEFLDESAEWHSRYALDILTTIRQHDPARQPLATPSSDSGSDSDSDSDRSHNSSTSTKSDSDGDALPTPTHEDRNTRIPANSTNPSPSSSRSCSPEPEEMPVSSTGRPLRKSAMNHRIAGIAGQMVSKKQRTG
ncbi:P-loop containing nucleoside triphosphate hydrolase protein [Mycena polygramma]|nr:P-loop containing nucleoside triphosphate hydrolase protein [Mycena polygramma]